MPDIIPIESIARKILVLRGQKVLLDKDLAELYEVETRALNKAVHRNIDRFPEDFMFQLSKEEFQNLMFQFGTSSWGGTRKLPYAFTEQGVAMLSSVLRSKKAVQVNIAIMRTFVELRKYLATQKDVKVVLGEHQRILQKHDSQIQFIFEAIEQLTKVEEKPKRSIGFHVEEPKVKYGVKR
ncbi:MAG: ORF6N domain-containing protein [Ignavibacteriales bacterium]|nr:ORF6N domain-containing protein [Ignavibacteriales bacterium]